MEFLPTIKNNWNFIQICKILSHGKYPTNYWSLNHFRFDPLQLTLLFQTIF